MAIAGFLDLMYLALRASGLRLRYATLQNLIPFLSLDCTRTPSTPAQSKERKGSNFAIWQPCHSFERRERHCSQCAWHRISPQVLLMINLTQLKFHLLAVAGWTTTMERGIPHIILPQSPHHNRFPSQAVLGQRNSSDSKIGRLVVKLHFLGGCIIGEYV